MALKPGDRAAISVSGFDAMRSVMKVMGRDAGKEALTVLKGAGRVVASDASARAPRLTGKLAGSIKVGLRGSRVVVYSRLPYANVAHWGGTTGRGHIPGVGGSGSVKFARRPFLVQAADAKQSQFEQQLTDAMNRLADRV